MAAIVNAGDDLKRGDLFRVDPFQVIVKEELRGRCKPPSDEQIIDLAESMLDNGQQQPVQCRKVSDNRLQLNLGFSRTAAARLIRTGFVGSDGEQKQDSAFLLKVVVSEANDEQAFLNNIIENCHRNQTSDLDDAFNQERLRDRNGKSDLEIAKLYGYRDVNRVSRLKVLLSAPLSVQNLVQSGTMSTPAVAELMELPEEKRAEAIEHAQSNSTNGKVSAPAIRSQVREHHLRDETNGKPVKKPLSMAELRKFIAEEKDDVVAGTPLHRLIDTLMKFMAGERTVQTMKKVFLETTRAGEDGE